MGKAAERKAAVVVGGGIVGLAAALSLAKRGLPVCLLEKHRFGHELGSSHGDGRIFRFTYPEPLYVEMARRALEGWRELESESGQALVARSGNWDGGPARSPRLAALASALAANGVPFERLGEEENQRRFPQLRLPEGGEALYQPEGGVVLADRAIQTLERLARDRGAELLEGEGAARIDLDGRNARIETSQGRTLETERMVVAAGGWCGQLLAPLGVELPLTLRREVLAYLPVRPGAKASHRVGTLPTFLDYRDCPDDGPACPFYGLPQIEVPGVKVGLHRHGPRLDTPEEQAEADATLLSETLAAASRLLPALAPRPVRVSTCLYTDTPDLHFVLDRLPVPAPAALGAGFSGHGFKFAPLLGELLADLVLGDEPGVRLSPFALDRFQGAAPLIPRSGV